MNIGTTSFFVNVGDTRTSFLTNIYTKKKKKGKKKKEVHIEAALIWSSAPTVFMSSSPRIGSEPYG